MTLPLRLWLCQATGLAAAAASVFALHRWINSLSEAQAGWTGIGLASAGLIIGGAAGLIWERRHHAR